MADNEIRESRRPRRQAADRALALFASGFRLQDYEQDPPGENDREIVTENAESESNDSVDNEDDEIENDSASDFDDSSDDSSDDNNDDNNDDAPDDVDEGLSGWDDPDIMPDDPERPQFVPTRDPGPQLPDDHRQYKRAIDFFRLFWTMEIMEVS